MLPYFTSDSDDWPYGGTGEYRTRDLADRPDTQKTGSDVINKTRAF